MGSRSNAQAAEQTAHPTAVRAGGRVLPQIVVLKSVNSRLKRFSQAGAAVLYARNTVSLQIGGLRVNIRKLGYPVRGEFLIP